MAWMVLSLLFGLLGPAAEPPAMGHPTGAQNQTPADNAAFLYYQAWLMESPETMARLTKGFCPPGGVCRLPEEWEPDNEVDGSLIAAHGAIGRLIKAAGILSCDFGNDASEGPDMRLPHLSRMRGSAQLLQADAVRLTLAGDSNGAAERVAALYGLSRHTIDGNTCIASLVSAGLGDRANESAARLCAAGLTTEGRDMILSAIGRCNGGDPFGCKRAVAGEKAMVMNWAKRFTGSDAGQRLGRSSLLEGMEAAAGAEFAAAVSALDGESVGLLVGRYGAMCDELLDAWDEADASERIKAIRARAERGEFGVMARALAPTLSSVFATNRIAVESRRDAIEKLKKAILKQGD